ncbi:hypothetical protein D3C84_1025370 [compost metagenome]
MSWIKMASDPMAEVATLTRVLRSERVIRPRSVSSRARWPMLAILAFRSIA